MNKKTLALIAITLACPAFAADTPPAKAPTQEEVIAQFRSDLMAKRADVVAKITTLTAEQAAKFWPLYEDFQKEQQVIVDGQLQATQAYAKSFPNPTEADSLAYVNALLERDQKMHDLRVMWLKKFQEAVPPGTAARVIHIERRLGLATQARLSSQIPLVR